MIRVTQQDNAKAAKSYYTTADYYTEGQEIVGSWGGLGASRLGLSGTVDKFSFERLGPACAALLADGDHDR